MKRAFLAFLCVCTFGLCAAAADGPEFSRGDQYLDQVARQLADHPSCEILLGRFSGRKWNGYYRLKIRSAPADSGGRFEAIEEWELQGKSQRTGDPAPVSRTSHAIGSYVLAPDLTVLSSHYEYTSAGNPKLIRDCDQGLLRTKEWNEATGTWGKEESRSFAARRWASWLLPFLLVPGKEEIRLRDSFEEADAWWGWRTAAPQAPRLGKAMDRHPLLEMTLPDNLMTAWWFVDPEGDVVELQVNGAERWVKIDAAAFGKNLAEPLTLDEPTRAVLDLFLAARKDETDVVRAAFDWEKLAESAIPGFAAGSPAERETALRGLEKQALEKCALWMGPWAPEVADLEDVIGPDATSRTLEQGRVEVTAWWRKLVLYRCEEGARKGRWLVCGW